MLWTWCIPIEYPSQKKKLKLSELHSKFYNRLFDLSPDFMITHTRSEKPAFILKTNIHYRFSFLVIASLIYNFNTYF